MVMFRKTLKTAKNIIDNYNSTYLSPPFDSST